MPNQSESQTYLCSDLIRLTIPVEDGPARVLDVNLEDISEHSATVLSDAHVPCGTRVRLLCQSHIITGVVEFSSYEEILGTFLQIRLDPDSRWSPALFTPQHLLKLWSELEDSCNGSAENRAA